MKPDDFEKHLRAVPIRPVPDSWRNEILGAAHKAAQSQETRGGAVSVWWRELLWPCPQAWAGLAAAWVFIIASQFTESTPHTTTVSQSAQAPISQSADIITAGLSPRAWAKLIDGEEAPADLPKTAVPPKRTSVVTYKYVNVCCARFGFWLGATREHVPNGPATEEQRRQNPNMAQPFGRHVFLAQSSLLAPYRPMQVCSSRTPRLSQKSIAANINVFVCHHTCIQLSQTVV